MRDRARNQVKINARVGRNQYLCNKCKTIITGKEVKVDHIEPVTPVTGWENLDSFVTRLKISVITEVAIKSMQALCEKCHDAKSKVENEIRRTSKKSKKINK